MDDLRWLGLDWDGGADADTSSNGATASYFQSERTALYQAAFERLQAQGLVYDCYCRRADLFAASAPHASDGTPIYSGRCRTLGKRERDAIARASNRPPAQRVCVSGTVTQPVRPTLSRFTDGHYGAQAADLARDCGDFVLRRADGNFAYQLAVTVDDAAMGVTEVVRGRDLLASTHQQLFLYRALSLTPPRFAHLPLLVDESGRRLSKRDRDCDMGALRARHTPEELVGAIMHLCGLAAHNEPMTAQEAVPLFSWERLPTADIVVASGAGSSISNAAHGKAVFAF